MNAVAGHEQIRFDTTDRAICGPVDELAPDSPTFFLPEADEMVASVDALTTQPLDHGAVQDAEELTSMNGQLRPPIAGSEPPWLAPNPLPVLGVVDEFRRGNAQAGQFIEETELGQLAHSVR